MNLAVAVHAAFVERGYVITSHGLMPPQHVHMAILAKDGTSGLQQVRVIRSVRDVACVAVRATWSVLPEEGAAFLGMTLVTEGVGRTGGQHFRSFSAMRIVTGGASELDIPMLSPE